MAGMGTPLRAGVAVLSAMVLAALGAAPQAVAAPDVPTIVVQDGVTQPVFGYADAIRERLFIDSTFDSDNDGLRDIIAFDLMRPAATANGLKVPGDHGRQPVLLDARPGQRVRVQGRPGRRRPARQVAAVLRQLLRAARLRGRSCWTWWAPTTPTGCPTTSGATDNLSAKAGDQLAQRPGHRLTTPHGKVVSADWHNGKTGMIGKSLRRRAGQRRRGDRRQGPDDRSCRSRRPPSYYDYTRSNGVVHPAEQLRVVAGQHGHRTRTGASTASRCATRWAPPTVTSTATTPPFWNERNYVKEAPNMTASVLF